jgi:flagellar hook-basal body complex protein FliE
MIERATSAANIASMLQTMRALQTEAGAGPAALNPLGTPGVQPGQRGELAPAGFGQMVKGALGQVNEMQVESRRLQSAYERGEDLPLTDVVLGMQKSSLAFEATLQIRNKVLKAYEDILNMPV